jgi:hypothetical protein
MLGTSETIPVAEGELLLGTWQRIFLVELDGPRSARETPIELCEIRRLCRAKLPPGSPSSASHNAAAS